MIRKLFKITTEWTVEVRNTVLIVAGILVGMASAAAAEFSKVNDQSQFVQLVQGKTLTRPFVRLEVSPRGEISGIGAAWDVTGQWSWQDGYFCRDLYWGGDALGYNCQQVEVRNERIRFTSDRGQGDSAEFTLR